MSTVMPSTAMPWNMGSQVTDAAGSKRREEKAT